MAGRDGGLGVDRGGRKGWELDRGKGWEEGVGGRGGRKGWEEGVGGTPFISRKLK